jgi:hypothetical protein
MPGNLGAFFLRLARTAILNFDISASGEAGARGQSLDPNP